jgi:hypothetical protein
MAAIGAVRLWKARPEMAMLLGSACLAYSLIYTVIEVSMRYRFPLEGFLLLLSSYAICPWLSGGSGRSIATASGAVQRF